MGNTPSKAPPSNYPSAGGHRLSRHHTRERSRAESEPLPRDHTHPPLSGNDVARRPSARLTSRMSHYLHDHSHEEQKQSQQQVQPQTPPLVAPASSPAAATPSAEPSKAVQVPVPSNQAFHGYRNDFGISPSGPPASSYYGFLQRPPWLPLPIGDATTAPGSPILPAVSDTDTRVPPIDDTTLTLDERVAEGLAEDEELEADPAAAAVAGTGTTGATGNAADTAVSTAIEWRGRGDNVFVTGTFANWERKFRLRQSDHDENTLASVLQLRPGTHHLRFLVDGVMRTSDQLPTAVDFTNHLVNYIEVGTDDRERWHEEPPPASPAGVHPPQVVPGKVDMGKAADGKTVAKEATEAESEAEAEEEVAPSDMRAVVPGLFVDLDEDDGADAGRNERALAVLAEAAAPPALPLFLTRSILNGQTPKQDDSSVLYPPNHTVLNHLATSSIKNGVLATSVTTRYKRKCLTTILYKPTGTGTD